VVETVDALRLAEEKGLDLVEISPEVRPPVCRLLDYGKYRFEQAKADRAKRKNATDNTPKEIRLRPSTDQHDLEVKIGKARQFLDEGNRVRMTVRFRGGELRRQDVGMDTLRRALDMLKDAGRLQSETPEMQGRMVSVTLTPMKRSGGGPAPSPTTPQGTSPVAAPETSPTAARPAPAPAAAPAFPAGSPAQAAAPVAHTPETSV
jgi:translation initiation factor IF-3